jgi:hypothetical protein
MPKSFQKTCITVVGLIIALGSIFVRLPQTAKADSYTISPPKYELFANPGDSLSEKLKVRNDGDTQVTYQVNVEDFRAEGDDGSINLVDPQTSRDSFSLASWITAEPNKFTVPANEEAIVTFTIHVPKTGEPGGHYATVLIKQAGAGDTSTSGATVDTRVGSLILLRVSGNTTEKATLESFNAENGFQQYGPINFNMRFKNEGNVHVAPTGTIVISNIFGKKVKEIPFVPANVLPDANRVIKASWDDKGMIGRYTASLVVTYGQSKQTLAGSTSFIVFPIWLMVVILAVIVLIYLLVAKRKTLKRIINNLTRE